MDENILTLSIKYVKNSLTMACEITVNICMQQLNLYNIIIMINTCIRGLQI